MNTPMLIAALMGIAMTMCGALYIASKQVVRDKSLSNTLRQCSLFAFVTAIAIYVVLFLALDQLTNIPTP